MLNQEKTGGYMKNFTYYNPVKIIFGKNSIRALRNQIPAQARIMLTYGQGSIKKNGTYEEIKKILSERIVSEFGGIEPNPTYETLMKCVSQVKENNIDYLLAAGGGSVIDGTKFIAAAACYESDPWEIITSFGSKVEKAIKFATVLTLPASASEMNSGAVITRKELGCKLPFNSEHVFPQFSILDPEKTYSLPLNQVSNGIIDAFVHVTEQYLTESQNAAVQDRFAESLLLTLIEEGPKALENPQDYKCRSNLMWASTMALNKLIGMGVSQDWSTHMIGHELTTLYGLDHAVTLAIVLPAVLRFKKESKKGKLIQYAQRVWAINSSDENEIIDQAILKTEQFFNSLGVKTRLSDYNINQDAPEKVEKALTQHNMTRLGENRDITPQSVNQLLKTCY